MFTEIYEYIKNTDEFDFNELISMILDKLYEMLTKIIEEPVIETPI